MIDLTGQKFDKITVIEKSDSDKYRSLSWLCKCDCGRENLIINGTYLREGITTHCGCSDYNDLVGKRFEMLEIIRCEWDNKNKFIGYLCKCDCGNKKIIQRTRLTKGENKSCGCLKHKKIDYTGQKFGMLTVIKRTRVDSARNVYWECQCDCGNIKEVLGRSFVYGGTLSCGCLTKIANENKAEDLTGQKFNRLTALELIRVEISKGNRGAYWKCICDCGNYKNVAARLLKNGSIKSCGCLRKERHLLAHKKDMGIAAQNAIFSAYKGSAKSRGLDFELTKEKMLDIIQKNCYYCNKSPSNIQKVYLILEIFYIME